MSVICYIKSTDTTVLCATRCGHTSMQRYLGLDPNNPGGGKDFTNTDISKFNSEQVILCIRNPYDRLLSAVQNTAWMTEHHPERIFLDPYLQGWTESHSTPFLRGIVLTRNYSNCITHLLPFDELQHYIPRSQDTWTSQVIGGVTEYEEWMGEYWSQKVLESEYSAYTQLLSSVPKVSVEDWLQFTDA